MADSVPFRNQALRRKQLVVDFDVGDPEVIEQSSFEIEEITLTGEHQVVIETGVVSDITITGEHRAIDS